MFLSNMNAFHSMPFTARMNDLIYIRVSLPLADYTADLNQQS